MATMTATKPDATGKKLITADELLVLDAKGIRGELIRGEFNETKPDGMQHSGIAVNLGVMVLGFAKSRRLGRVTAPRTGVWLERDPDTVRESDMAFFSEGKRRRGDPVPGYAEVVPDLVVEVVSQNDTPAAIHDKALMWLCYGVRLVWVVRPNWREIAVYRADEPILTLTEADYLDGLDVLPGFTCAVSEVFESMDA